MLFLLAGIPFGASVVGSAFKWGSRLVLAVKAFNFVSGYGALAASSLFESPIDVNAENIVFPEHVTQRRFNPVTPGFVINEVTDEKGQQVCGETVYIAGKDRKLDENGEYFYCEAENRLIFAKKGLPLVDLPVMLLSPVEKDRLNGFENGVLSAENEKAIRNVFKNQFIQPRPVINVSTNPKIKTETIREHGVKVEVCREVVIGGKKRAVNKDGEYFLYGNNLVIAQYGYPRQEIDLSDQPLMRAKLKNKGDGQLFSFSDECELRRIIEAKIEEQNEALLEAFIADLPKPYRESINKLRANEKELKEIANGNQGVFSFLTNGVDAVISQLTNSKDDFSKVLGYRLRIARLLAQKETADKDKARIENSRKECGEGKKNPDGSLNRNESWYQDGKLKELENHKKLIEARKAKLERMAQEINDNNNLACKVFENDNRGKKQPLQGTPEKMAKAIHAKLQNLFPDVSFLTKIRFMLTGRYTSYKIFREAVCGKAISGEIAKSVASEVALREEIEKEIRVLDEEIRVTDEKIVAVNEVKAQIVAKKAEVKEKVKPYLAEVKKQEEFISNQEAAKEKLVKMQQEQQVEADRVAADVLAFKSKREALELFYGISNDVNPPTLIGKQNTVDLDAIDLAEPRRLILSEKEKFEAIDKETNKNLTPQHVVSGGGARLSALDETGRSLDEAGQHASVRKYINEELGQKVEALRTAKEKLQERQKEIDFFKDGSLAYATGTITNVLDCIAVQLRGYDEALKAAVDESINNPFFHEHGLLYQAIQQRGELAHYLNDSSLAKKLDAKGEAMRQKLLAIEGLPADQYSEKLNEIKNGNLEQLKVGLSEAMNQFNELRSKLKELKDSLTSQNYAEKIEEIGSVISELQELSQEIDGLKLEVEAATKLARDNAEEADKIIHHVNALAKEAEERMVAAKAEVEESNASMVALEDKPALVQRPLTKMEPVADMHVNAARKDIVEKTAFINAALKGMSESSVELKQLIDSLEVARKAGDIETIRSIYENAKAFSEQNHDNYAFIQAAILVRQACEMLLLKGQVEQLANEYAAAEGNSAKQAGIRDALALKKQQIMNGLDALNDALSRLKIEAEQSSFSIAENTSLRRNEKQAGLLVEVNGKRLYDESLLAIMDELNNIEAIVHSVERAIEPENAENESKDEHVSTVQSGLRVLGWVLDRVFRSSDVRPSDIQYIEIDIKLQLNKTELAALLSDVKSKNGSNGKISALAQYMETEVAKAEDSREANSRLDSEFFDNLIQKIKETGNENVAPYSDWIAKVVVMKNRYEEVKKEYFKQKLIDVLESEPEDSEELDDRLVNLGSNFFARLVEAMDNELAKLVTRNGTIEKSDHQQHEVSVNGQTKFLNENDKAVYDACNNLKRRAVRIGAKIIREENRARNAQRIAETEAAVQARIEVETKISQQAESLIMERILLVLGPSYQDFFSKELETPEEMLKAIFEKVDTSVFARIIKGLEVLKNSNDNPAYDKHYDHWIQVAKKLVSAGQLTHRTLLSKGNPFAVMPTVSAQSNNPFDTIAPVASSSVEAKVANTSVAQDASTAAPSSKSGDKEVTGSAVSQRTSSGIFGFFKKPEPKAGETTSPSSSNAFKRVALGAKAAISGFIINASTWISALFESGGTGVL